MTAFSPPTRHDILELCMNLRSVDEYEIFAVTGSREPSHIVEVITNSVEDSGVRCAAARDDEGHLLCIFGVTPQGVLGWRGVPWLLATDRLDENRRELLVRARWIVNDMKREFLVLENVVWEKNEKSIRFLTALGFEFGDPVVNPLSGEKLMHFRMDANV